jgi:hypothetical protein
VFRHSSLNLPLKDSAKALSVGLSGREKSSSTPCSQAQRSSSLEMNSGPWTIGRGDPLQRRHHIGAAVTQPDVVSTRIRFGFRQLAKPLAEIGLLRRSMLVVVGRANDTTRQARWMLIQ